MKVSYIFYCFLLATQFACGDLPKEGDGTEKVEVKVELRYDNGTTQLGPLIEYMVLDY